MENNYVIFDRDGTLIDHVPYLNKADLVRFKPDLISSLQKLQKYGFKFGIISNQSAIGRGLATFEDVIEINSKISLYLQENHIRIQFSWFCPHTPSDNCGCRKPLLGLGLKALSTFNLNPEKSYMVGDQESDILFGRNLGCKTIYIGDNSGSVSADYSTNELILAANWIIQDYRSSV